MTLEGGVENADWNRVGPERMAEIVEDVMRQGKPGGGFILAPTSDATTWSELSARHVANYAAFAETWARLADYD